MFQQVTQQLPLPGEECPQRNLKLNDYKKRMAQRELGFQNKDVYIYIYLCELESHELPFKLQQVNDQLAFVW